MSWNKIKIKNRFLIGQLHSHSTDGPQGLGWHERRAEVKLIPTQAQRAACPTAYVTLTINNNNSRRWYIQPSLCVYCTHTHTHTWYKYAQWGWNTPTRWRKKKRVGVHVVLLRFIRLLKRLLLRLYNFVNRVRTHHAITHPDTGITKSCLSIL